MRRFRLTGERDDNKNTCETVRELIAWYPGGTLGESERACVDEHTAVCPACADLLRFAAGFKDRLDAVYSRHPAAEALVRFVEDRSSMDPHEAYVIEQHLGICRECRDEASMLEAVDRSLAEEAATTAGRPETAPPTSPLRTLWDALKGGLLRPAPAAVYLVVAVVALGVLLLRPAGPIERGAGRTGVDVHTGSVPGTLGGVVILADETDRVRGEAGRDFTAARIDAAAPQFLLLELIGLEAPPADDVSYSVALRREGSDEPAFHTTARGALFSDNYTLCLSLEAGALMPGRYIVEVIDPAGTALFRSSVIVE